LALFVFLIDGIVTGGGGIRRLGAAENGNDRYQYYYVKRWKKYVRL